MNVPNSEVKVSDRNDNDNDKGHANGLHAN